MSFESPVGIVMSDGRIKRVIALLAVAGVPALLMIWYRMHQSTGFASVELIVYPLVFGSLGIAVIALLKRFYLGEQLSALNSGDGGLVSDCLWGLALTAVYFALFFVERYTLSDLLAFTPNRELLGLMLDMRESPWMVLVWFGPVLWIGIALYEELVRTFLLSEMWSFSNNKVWTAAVIILAATLVGLTHWNQGPYGIVTIAINGIVIGTFYLYRRRLLPLVIAHSLYDGLQVGALLLTYPR
jgi:membrane protease YdiL (CAAX protease family)